MGRKRSAGAVSDPCSRLVGTCPHSLGEDSGTPLDGDGGTLLRDSSVGFPGWSFSFMVVLVTIGKRCQFRKIGPCHAQAGGA